MSLITDEGEVVEYKQYKKTRLNNNLIKFNVIDSFILSFLDTNIRLIFYDTKLDNYDNIISFEFFIKHIPFYGGIYRRAKDSEIINKVRKQLYRRLNISNTNIRFEPSLSKLNYSSKTQSKISIEMKFSKEQMVQLNDKSEAKVFLKLYNKNGPLYDISYGMKMKYYYQTIYNVLYGKPGYTWYQYYSSILRFKWLEKYFLNPNDYMNVIPSLLEYFSGIDEICLFDIVCKLHIKKLDQKYKSFLDMRYRLKEQFMNKILNINILKFQHEWRIYHNDIHQLNNIHYINLEVCFGDYQINVDTLIGFIHNTNLNGCFYLMKKINMHDIYNDISNIKNGLSVSKFDRKQKNMFYKELEKVEGEFMSDFFRSKNNNLPFDVKEKSLVYDSDE